MLNSGMNFNIGKTLRPKQQYFQLFSIVYHAVPQEVNLCISISGQGHEKQLSEVIGKLFVASSPVCFSERGHIDKIASVWVRLRLRF
jgi:hypothetical protein